MKHSAFLVCLTLSLHLLLLSCGEESPVEPTLSPNSIVVESEVYQGSSIELLDSTSSIFYDTVEDVTTYEIEGIIRSSKVVAGAEENLKLVLRFPGKNVGTYDWSQLDDELDDDVVLLTIGDEEYYPQEGTTSITSYGEVGELVVGSFSGRLMDASETVEIVVKDGRLSAHRKEDGGDPDADAVLVFTLNGDGFNNVKISMTGNAPGFVHYNTDGGPHLDFIIPTGEIDIPGHGSGSVAFVFSFPGLTEGVRLWNLGRDSDFSMNIKGTIYRGIDGITQVSHYGRSFFKPVAGYFSGTLRNSDTGELIELKSGKFVTVRFN